MSHPFILHLYIVIVFDQLKVLTTICIKYLGVYAFYKVILFYFISVTSSSRSEMNATISYTNEMDLKDVYEIEVDSGEIA